MIGQHFVAACWGGPQLDEEVSQQVQLHTWSGAVHSAATPASAAVSDSLVASAATAAAAVSAACLILAYMTERPHNTGSGPWPIVISLWTHWWYTSGGTPGGTKGKPGRRRSRTQTVTQAGVAAAESTVLLQGCIANKVWCLPNWLLPAHNSTVTRLVLSATTVVH